MPSIAPHFHRTTFLAFSRPRGRGRRAALFLVLAACVLAARPAAAQLGVVAGRVVDEKTGQPVPGAAVQVGVLGRVATDAGGEFRLRLPVGTHDAVVRRIGYQPQGARWTVGADTLRVTVTLAPEALALAELRVVTNRFVRRLENRLRALPVSTRSYDRERIEKSVSPTAADYVRVHTGLFRAPCPGTRALDCVRRHMRTVPLSVWIDERRAIGGLQELDSVPLDEIGRVEVEDGVVVRVYTTRYLEDAARRGVIPMYVPE
jgi:hypothetical protein